MTNQVRQFTKTYHQRLQRDYSQTQRQSSPLMPGPDPLSKKVRLPLHFKLQLQNETLQFMSVGINPIELETLKLLELHEQTTQAVQAKTHKIKYVLMQLETHQLHAQNCFHLCFDRFYTFLPFYYFILTMLPCLLFCFVSNAKLLQKDQ